MNSKTDRRASNRVAVMVDVDVRGEGDEQRWLTSRDISEGGIGLGFTSLPANTRLQLTFALPDPAAPAPWMTFVIDGEVAWRKVGSTGVRFANLSPEERARLRAFLESQALA